MGLCLDFLRSGVSANGMNLHAAPAALKQVDADGSVVLITGLTGRLTIRVRDPSVLDLTPPEVYGTAAAFEVRRVAAGATRVEVSDSSGASANIAVTDIPNCLPPPAHLRLLGREVGRYSLPHEPSHPAKLYFTTDQPLDVVDSTAFAVRLVDSDGVVQKGSRISTADLDAVPSTVIKPNAGERVFVSYTEPLALNRNYHVWLVRAPCEPPYNLGTFST